MAGIHKIADINPTINNLCVRIQVIRLWTLPSYENSPLPYSIEMGGKIHASIKRVFVSRFMNLLEEEISYQIRYFGVRLNNGYFKTTHHEYVVNLNQRTDVHILPESSIPRYGFKLSLKIMECALFGNYAHQLNAFLGSDNKDGAVVVLQFVKVKLYNEKIVLQNSMYGTKMFFNLEDASVIQFKNNFIRFGEPRGNISGIPNEAAFLKIYQGKIIEQLKELDTIISFFEKKLRKK
ncbi:hypothetical protein Ahy_A06g028588 [Arachis hypogaea]|uniref:Replication protein A 70 kDa DNA-binding subunit B/D first OB fold domain-containing protein n=1 Tax=Arachis hypogaea TaxID=3818 RepID=A0A445CR98_ARAHY|nr:hypothetical protein Ahy_A06g028588 [Arachis hypogaea]